MKILKCSGLIFLVLSVFVWFGIKDALNPTLRTKIDKPVFTIGDIGYHQALEQGRNVVKFGQMFWGIYPGGLAFESSEEAINFTRSHQEILNDFSSGWSIYELSGDLAQDTYQKGNQRYLNKSLLVVKAVP